MRIRPLAVTLAVAGLALTGCGHSDEGTVTDGATSNGDPGTTITVKATDDACQLSATTAKPGTLAFTVTNDGSKTTEFYLYASDNEIIGEVENIGPGLTRTLTVDDVVADDYVTACKPGQTGNGIRDDFIVQ